MAFLAIEKKVSGSSVQNKAAHASPAVRALWLAGAMLVYGVHIGLAILCEYADWQLGLITLMIMFVGIFMVGVIVASMFLKQAIPYRMGDDGGSQTTLETIKKKDNTEQMGNTNGGFHEKSESKSN